ncbi:MAG TPA: hypothetical protein VE999_00180 [Gemmataceae bacterium]|nr:hypothetical protein [Gemmataceae bacterium]
MPTTPRPVGKLAKSISAGTSTYSVPSNYPHHPPALVVEQIGYFFDFDAQTAVTNLAARLSLGTRNIARPQRQQGQFLLALRAGNVCIASSCSQVP